MGVSVVLLAALGALWIRTAFRHDTIVWQRTRHVRNPAIAEGTLGAWEATLTTRSLGPHHRSLAYTRTEHLSLSDQAPDRSDTRRPAAERSPRLMTVDASGSRPNERVPSRFYHAPHDWCFAGFGVYPSTGGAMTHTTLEVPIWFLLLATSPPTLLAPRSALRNRLRRFRGLCAACGYDLSGQAGTCPECGTAGRSVAFNPNESPAKSSRRAV